MKNAIDVVGVFRFILFFIFCFYFGPKSHKSASSLRLVQSILPLYIFKFFSLLLLLSFRPLNCEYVCLFAQSPSPSLSIVHSLDMPLALQLIR